MLLGKFRLLRPKVDLRTNHIDVMMDIDTGVQCDCGWVITAILKEEAHFQRSFNVCNRLTFLLAEGEVPSLYIFRLPTFPLHWSVCN